MIYLLVGHRGTGKSHFLEELKKYLLDKHQEVIAVDLDKEIEKNTGESITDIISNEGEAAFRKVEQAALFNLFNESCSTDEDLIVVSLGAGYEEVLPESAKVIWIKRATDSMGRVFLDRPQLDHNLKPLDEYFNRYEKRNIRFQNLADEVLRLPENYKSVEPWLPVFWGFQPGEIGGCLTLLPWYLEDREKTKSFLLKRLSWGVHLFEIRADLLNIDQIHWVRDIVPDSMILLSIRGNPSIPFSCPQIDWPLELGEPLGKANIISLHQRSSQLDFDLNRLSQYKDKYLKLAIEINSWGELQHCHKWWEADPSNRSFLPRSKEGRWTWYRLLHKHKMQLNFFREDIGSSVDQPSFVDWCNFKYFKDNYFGAILGSPVFHSWTPEEQRKFWAQKQCNSLRIEIKEVEWTPQNLEFLKQLGLQYAAVTSPLKKLAFASSKGATDIAESLGAANTLLVKDGDFYCHNTDAQGFKILCESQVLPRIEKPMSDWKVAIWGGGGTLNMIRELFPNSVHFSARTQKSSSPDGLMSRLGMKANDQYDVLVWAIGRKNFNQGAQFPPEKMKFKYILDLNYTDDSPGKELAFERGIDYISGASMFKAQANGQRIYWDGHP